MGIPELCKRANVQRSIIQASQFEIFNVKPRIYQISIAKGNLVNVITPESVKDA